MTVRYINPRKDGVHPLRREVCDNYILKIVEGVENKEDWMSLEEIEAAQDYLYDLIVSKIQTHHGVTTLQ